MNQAEKFFSENAWPNEAQRFAQAESDAQLIGITFKWEPSQYPDLSWMEESVRNSVREVWDCVAFNPVTNKYASLSDITDPSEDYKRVVEAELALELLD